MRMRTSFAMASLIALATARGALAQVAPAAWAEGDTPGELSVRSGDVSKPTTVTAYVTSRAGDLTEVWQYAAIGSYTVRLPATLFSAGGFYRFDVINGSGANGTTTFSASVVPRPAARISGVPLFGVNTHFTQRVVPDTVYGLLSLANADLIRDQWVWSDVEKAPGGLQVPLSPNGGLPHQRQLLLANNLKILHDCAYGNAAYDNNQFPESEAAIAGFAKYCGFVGQQLGAALYGSEIWNESNKIDAASGYSPLVRATANVLKSVTPTAEILQGAGAGPGGGADPSYEEAVYNAIGASCCTGDSVHPYMTNPDVGYFAKNSGLSNPVTGQIIVNMDFVTFWLDALSHSFQKTTASNITETGWYTVLDGGNGVSESKQAAFTSRALIHATKPSACSMASATVTALPQKCTPQTSAVPDLKSIFIYDFRDDGTNTTNPQDNYGLVHIDLTPKMAYSAYAQAAGSLRGGSFYKSFKFADGSLANAYLYRLNSTEGLLVMWTAEFTPSRIAKTSADLAYNREGITRATVSMNSLSTGVLLPAAALQCREWDGHPCVIDPKSVAISNLPVFIRVRGALDDIGISESVRPGVVTGVAIQLSR